MKLVLMAKEPAWRLLFALTVFATPLDAQVSRDSLVAQASREFDATRRIQLLIRALDPSLGSPDASWSNGVQLLAQTYLDQRQDSASADVWLRWAIRLSPGLQTDTEQFLPTVADAVNAARAFVDQANNVGDSLTGTSWVWPKGPVSRDVGQMRISSDEPGMALEALIDGRKPLAPGTTIQLAPGTHEVLAVADGFDSVKVTREVLPGVTTVLEFRLRPEVVLVPPIQPPSGMDTPSAQPLVSPARSKHLPWIWVALGAGGAATAVWFITRPKTGTIRITVPNPQ